MNRSPALLSFALLTSLTGAGCTIWSSSSVTSNGPSCYDVTPATGSDAGVVPPQAPGASAPAGGSTVLAISRLYYGDTDRAGNPSPDAWKKYGLDIDGKVTSSCSTDVCTLAGGASNVIQLDGDDGIDNSFGANALPVIETFDVGLPAEGDQSLAAGDSTTLLKLDGAGQGANYASFPGALFRAAQTQSPRWDGTDVRDVDTLSLVGGSLSQPLASIPAGYMSERTWVGDASTGTAYVDLHFTIGGYPMPPIPIEHVRTVMNVGTDPASTTSGTLAGVIRTSDAVAWTRLWVSAAGDSLCAGSAGQGILTQVEQMSDIMADGTNGPGQPCDGISVGLGFDAVAVKLGEAKSVQAPPPPAPVACDGGTGAAGDGG
jgi:hypothetical protein